MDEHGIMGWVRSCESEVLSRFLFCFTWIVWLRKWDDAHQFYALIGHLILSVPAAWRSTTCWSCILGLFCACKRSSGANAQDARQGWEVTT